MCLYLYQINAACLFYVWAVVLVSVEYDLHLYVLRAVLH